MGGYGFIRFSLGMLPEATEFFIPLIMTLSIVAIIYTSLVALAQTDIKTNCIFICCTWECNNRNFLSKSTRFRRGNDAND